MQSESAIENSASVTGGTPARGRRRKRGTSMESGSAEEGPVFVDNSGRRAKLLRRFGVFLGVVCVGYAVVLGLAFMGWGISSSPSDLFPFGSGGRQAGAPGGGNGPQPQGGIGGAPSGAPNGTTGGTPGGTPPSGAPTAVPSASASASASAN